MDGSKTNEGSADMGARYGCRQQLGGPRQVVPGVTPHWQCIRNGTIDGDQFSELHGGMVAATLSIVSIAKQGAGKYPAIGAGCLRNDCAKTYDLLER